MNKRTFLGILSTLTILAFVSMAGADVATFQDTTATGNSPAAADALLRSGSHANNNFGVMANPGEPGDWGDRWYPTNATVSNALRNNIFWWDISSITTSLQPGESIQVNSASFSLFMREGQDLANAGIPFGTPLPGKLSRVIAGPWNEGGQNAPALTGEVTWNSRSQNVATWQTPGGTGANDIDMTVDFMTAPPSDGSRARFRQYVDVTDIAKSWLEDGESNYGLMLHSTAWGSGSSSLAYFCYNLAHNEYIGTDYLNRRPMLTIDYSIVPEPTALVLLGLGGLLSLRRRK